MVEHSTKRKKYHDKDKYYKLAKEQGLRSRAAFKLAQINRKYNIIEKCNTAILDLCAAPGGWTQILSRTLGSTSTVPIIAVDILPIRNLHTPNVITLIGDITTDQCKADIKRTLQQHGIKNHGRRRKSNNPDADNVDDSNDNKVDLVLHDGAPNIGADYNKDAYEQNEMVLHAARVATQHLKRDGTFITKVYRSRDYTTVLWILQQLFDKVDTFKPKASRLTSSEIFLICLQYKAPIKGIDYKLLDPKYAFDTANISSSTMNQDNADKKKTMNIFDKNWDKPIRQRGGYDFDHYDFTMRHIESIIHFINCTTMKEAITMLSRSTGLQFTKDDDVNIKDYIMNHPLTTKDIKLSLEDLQVLNKSDFKSLLNWRILMQEAVKIMNNDNNTDQKLDDDNDNDMDDEDDDDDDVTKVKKDGDNDSDDDDEEMIQGEIEEMRVRRSKEKKRQLKKERAIAAKRRKKIALNSSSMTIDIHDDPIFSLSSIPNQKILDRIANDIDLDKTTDEAIFGTEEENDEDIVIMGKDPEYDDDDSNSDDDNIDEKKVLKKREKELNEAYELYLQTTKDGLAKSNTKMAKRSKKLQREKVINEVIEDNEMLLNNDTDMNGMDYDKRQYVQLLTGKNISKTSNYKKRNDGDSSDDDNNNADRDSDDSDDDNDNDSDGFHDEPMTPDEYQQKKKSTTIQNNNRNSLIHKFDDSEPKSATTARWFSNPLFATMGQMAKTTDTKNTKKRGHVDVSDNDTDGGSDIDTDGGSDIDGNEKRRNNNNKTKNNSKNKKLTADDVLAMMPRTDKQRRHEKRLKTMEKDAWKKELRAKKAGIDDGDMQIVARNDDDDDDDSIDDHRINEKDQLKHLSEDQKKKIIQAKELIKAGMGRMNDDPGNNNGSSSIEIVSKTADTIPNRPLPVMDDRKYDSEHEDYDSDDYAETLAIGTMIVQSKSKEKAFVDASYNRYSWNDPKNLPEWFCDDEKKHYRPQLPIPPALLAKMKQQMITLSVKPIKKVAEARARKNKRAKLKLVAAKKKAESVAKSPDMTEAMKLKAISKALQQKDNNGKGVQQKQYIVAKKGRGNSYSSKNVKVVDKRLKCDIRATKRIDKKKKNGGKIQKRKGR